MRLNTSRVFSIIKGKNKMKVIAPIKNKEICQWYRVTLRIQKGGEGKKTIKQEWMQHYNFDLTDKHKNSNVEFELLPPEVQKRIF